MKTIILLILTIPSIANASDDASLFQRVSETLRFNNEFYTGLVDPESGYTYADIAACKVLVESNQSYCKKL